MTRAMQAEGTVMLYVSDSVRSAHPIQRDIMKQLRSGTHRPETVMKHFTLFLALSLTSTCSDK